VDVGESWFRPRRYKHFDYPVAQGFIDHVTDPKFVAAHSFSPLIHYVKATKRYKPALHRTNLKQRDIMYASHRDACILSFYAHQLSAKLDACYAAESIGDNVLAYRRLGRSNYHFAAEAYRLAQGMAPCAIIALDVSGFFDALDHRLLKQRHIDILGGNTLPDDWYAVFKAVTRYHYVDLDDLKANPAFAEACARRGAGLIGTIAQVISAGIKVHSNQSGTFGIPQGTPISAVLSNLYLLEFDRAARAYCDSIGAHYRRYSDDILVICPAGHALEAEAAVTRLLSQQKLSLSRDKTEVTEFLPGTAVPPGHQSAQYLGFNLSPRAPSIRPSSMSRQWRKMRKAIKRAKVAASRSAEAGGPGKVFARKLRRRFSPLRVRNFSSYARRGADAFDNGESIRRQALRLERAFERELKKP
jgi:RNA-directed DNA polymerase